MRRTLTTLAIAGISAGLATSCRGAGDENLGLSAAPPSRIALDKLTEPDVLVAALRQPMIELDGKLGARGLDVQQTLELTGDDHGQPRTDRVDQTIHFDTDGKGGFHLVRELGHPLALAPATKNEDSTEPPKMVDPSAQGMEAIEVGGRWFVRARFSRYAERRPEPGELERVRALGEKILGDDVALVLPFASVEERAPGTLLGRKTRVLALSLAKKKQAPPKVDDPRRAWRAEVTVSSLTAELELDAETGAPLRAKLDARYRVPAKQLDVHLTLQEDARNPAAIEAPTDAILAPHRPRPTTERNQLLDGLAPAVGTQGGHS